MLEPLLRKMNLRDTPVDRAQLARINVEHGKDLPELPELAARTVARCPEPFPKLVAQDVPARILARNLA
ncbi:MAG: hypothetical protein RMK29_18320, partial [Myxococcales bacterium]|nr:hypothetical protein [Myxococcales bacterium]